MSSDSETIPTADKVNGREPQKMQVIRDSPVKNIPLPYFLLQLPGFQNTFTILAQQ